LIDSIGTRRPYRFGKLSNPFEGKLSQKSENPGPVESENPKKKKEFEIRKNNLKF